MEKKNGLGADGISIGFTILWLQEGLKEKTRINRKCTKKMIKWLKSEMRWYIDFGSFNPFVGDVCDRYFSCRKERLEKEVTK